MNARFVDVHVLRDERLSLGKDTGAGTYFLSIPVANQLVNYEEYYRLTATQFDAFSNDPAAAAQFAELCRQRKQDALLILAPGHDRGVAQ